MAAVRVSIKFAKATTDLDFESPDVTLGELRRAVEAQLSVPVPSQQLICGGRRWQGVAFADDLKVVEAAGPKGTKEADGLKVVGPVMLMAPAGSDGSEAVNKGEEKIDEAASLLGELPEDGEPEGVRKQLLVIDDLLSQAEKGLDSVTLVGAQRERRRKLLARIEAMGNDVASRKANL
mmetsp:Transcript_67022/g.181249  ORF Transcript_67022/g.181249 Transcript_67022/m.181249 type:complete len:178 (-) Transcript_67022:54-587(-)